MTLSTSTLSTSRSKLDQPPLQFVGEPFFDETVTLLRSVRDHDFDTLAALCDDDFGIVDIDPSGAARPLRTRGEWEAWFHGLFATLDSMDAATDSEIVDYHAVRNGQLGYSALEFRQFLLMSDRTATFDCVATIIWKQTPAGWREARWHASVITSDLVEHPVSGDEEGLTAAA